MGDRNTRYDARGRVYISEVTSTDALLKNLSASGLCITSADFMDVVPNTRYSVDIIPEKDSNIDQFSLEIESRWVKAKLNSSETGFVIVVPPGTSGKTVLEKYLLFLASRQEAEANTEEIDNNDNPIDISKKN